MSEGKPAPPRVLIIDDQLSMAEMLADGLSDRGYDAVALSSSVEAARLLRDGGVDALVTDLRMPGIDGLELLAVSRRADPARPVIVMTAFSAVDSAIESIRQGAYHYLTKPFRLDELALFLERALDEARVRREATALKRTLKERFAWSNIVGKSAPMRELADLVERVGDAVAPVLIVGETGTGKGLVARAIHAQGARSGGPFISLNCAALPEALLESELFGHVKGAFTGAISNRAGLIEEASGGTLFLDEIAEMALPLQAKLLHVLESGTVRAVGANRERPTDARVIAATHRDLHQRVVARTFREDLLYRLDVLRLEVPPLRHRADDIPVLIEHFLRAAKARYPQSVVERLSAEAMTKALAHAWPGNVRELQHVIERSVLLGRSTEAPASDLPFAATVKGDAGTAFHGEVLPLREVQRRYAVWAYDRLAGRKLHTADKLGVDVKTLGRLLVERPADEADAADEADEADDPEK
jgi:two-component system, NtrC family, response regulator HydG